MLEVEILLMTYLIKYVFQIRQKIWIYITGKNESKILKKIYYANVNVDLMGKNVIQINGGIMVNVDLSVKDVMYVKKDYISKPATCSCENEKHLASIKDDSAITCN